MRIRLLLLLTCGALLSAAEPQIFDNSGDVGKTQQKGKVEYNSATGEYTITGGGANIWATVDAFQYAWKKISGDFSLTADVRLVGTGAHEHRKAVLMVRQTLDPDSPYADAALHGDGSVALQFRPTVAAVTQQITTDMKMPLRIRIQRRGNNFSMYTGTPGQQLRMSGPTTVTLTDPVYVGLGMCAHKEDVLETAVFSNVKLEPIGPAPRFSSKVTIFDLRNKSTRVVFQSNDIVEAPNWSRDGKHLLINTKGRLYRVPVDGGPATPEPLKLDEALRCNNDHDYSRDGKWLALSASSPNSRGSQVYIASADGSGARLLVSGTPSYFHGWAPDGHYVSYVAQRNNNYDLYRMLVGGGPEERLTSASGYDDGPDYSPDGQWIYFNSERTGNFDIWRMPADGAGEKDAKAERITSDEWEDWFPHPSPDGKSLLFFSFPPGTQGHNGRMPGVQLRMIPMPGKSVNPVKPQVITTFFGGQGTINVNSWAPDSKRFAYVVFEPIPADPAK